MNDSFTAATELLHTDRPSREAVMRAGELYELASSQGHAEATERLALFEAFGIVRQQSWDRALDWLELAARQGSRSAREQLLLLADNDRDPSVSDEASDDFWRHLHARISVDDRIVAGEKIPLSESPRIRIIKQFATE